MTDFATLAEIYDIHHAEDKLFCSLAEDPELGDRIVVYDREGDSKPFWLEVLSWEPTGYLKHRHFVAFKSDRAEELRRRLTYEVGS